MKVLKVCKLLEHTHIRENGIWSWSPSIMMIIFQSTFDHLHLWSHSVRNVTEGTRTTRRGSCLRKNVPGFYIHPINIVLLPDSMVYHNLLYPKANHPTSAVNTVYIP
jgi:hypothetical protein